MKQKNLGRAVEIKNTLDSIDKALKMESISYQSKSGIGFGFIDWIDERCKRFVILELKRIKAELEAEIEEL